MRWQCKRFYQTNDVAHVINANFIGKEKFRSTEDYLLIEQRTHTLSILIYFRSSFSLSRHHHTYARTLWFLVKRRKTKPQTVVIDDEIAYHHTMGINRLRNEIEKQMNNFMKTFLNLACSLRILSFLLCSFQINISKQ